MMEPNPVAVPDEDDDGWTYPWRPELQHYICSLMSYKHGRWADPYPKETTFTKQQLNMI
jgi:hypothetical protein